ncbi:MAG: hypothetical protein B7Z04_07105, partial [Rhodobacterales bacterium 32-66-9]
MSFGWPVPWPCGHCRAGSRCRAGGSPIPILAWRCRTFRPSVTLAAARCNSRRPRACPRGAACNSTGVYGWTDDRRPTLRSRETRRKAGVLAAIPAAAGTPSGSGRAIGLDVTVSAPARVFVRGRGIDAELGGELRLLGTIADVRPSGGFSLIRGRIDILGRRLVLSRADLVLEGSLVPQIGIAADTASDGITSTVTVEGPADDPEVRFASSPELPQEEVLARL